MRHQIHKALTLALVLSAGPGALDAQVSTPWTARGPFCARPHDLAAPRRAAAPAYLAVGGRLFRSVDGWMSWTEIGAGLPSSYLSAVAAVPADPRVAYFGIFGGGIFRTDDAGASWKRVFEGLPDDLVEQVVVPVGARSTVFARLGYSGIYRSSDRGVTWKDVSPTTPRPATYYSLVADPLLPRRLGLVTSDGLWRSEDDGNTWRHWMQGLPQPGSGPSGIGHLIFAPVEGDIAFVTAYKTLYRSDRGRPWRRVGDVPVNTFIGPYALTAVPGDSRGIVLFVGQIGEATDHAGALRSLDGGKTWKPTTLRGETVFELTYLRESRRVVALTSQGAWYSSNLGVNWIRTGDGVAAADVRALAAGQGRTVLAGLHDCPAAVARSADGGASWRLRDARVPGLRYSSQGLVVDALATAPSRRSRAYGGAGDFVLRSEDGGLTWALSGFQDGLSGAHTWSIAVHPTNPDVVVVAGGHGLRRSVDGARTWLAEATSGESFGEMLAVAFDPQDPSRLLASSFGGGIVKSEDTGATWEIVPGTESLRADSLAYHPTIRGVVLAVDRVGDATVHRSTDGGQTWVASDIGLDAQVSELAFTPDGTWAAVGGEDGVFLSDDGGVTWEALDGEALPARALLFADGRLFVGTDQGVYSARLAE
jgi:photosystem II stability/assembly factor-like uncharacterized protein